MLSPAAVLVAVVAGGGAVGVTVDALVSVIGARFLVSGFSVAIDAGEAGEIGGDLMAVVANRAMVRNREIRSVVKGGAEPAGGVVAAGSIAGGGESCGDVVRNGAAESLRAGPLRDMAAIAGGVGGGQGVVAADMTIRAGLNAAVGGGNNVTAGKRPAGGAVIEFAVSPDGDGVATRAGRGGLREIGSDVIGNAAVGRRIGGIPSGQMAAQAIGIRGSQIVLVADVAQGAGGGGVCADKSEAGGAVIEVGGTPAGGGVAGGAVGKRKGCTGRGVHRLRGGLPSGEVAARSAAGGWRDLQRVVIRNMAIDAGVDFARRRELMQILQREAGSVVAPGRSPIRGGVARGTLRRRKASRNVIGYDAAEGGRTGPSRLVTAIAIGVGGGQGVIVIDVALHTGGGGEVIAGQGPAGDAVIERGGGPRDGVVASGAVRGGKRSTGSGVRGIVGALPSGEVATGIAAIVGLNGEGVIVINVARSAVCSFASGNKLMRVGKRETGGAVIKRRSGPS